MRILFDQGTPVPLRQFLQHHETATAFECGWATLRNGELLDAAEQNGFDVLVTTDKSLRHQQNLDARHIAIVVLGTTSWPRIQGAITEVVLAIDSAARSGYVEIPIP